ncbi:MAG: ATP-binding protein [Methanomicrobiales archaeon]|nr:ATP-binding protein [Methanomicrobiales archaeon]
MKILAKTVAIISVLVILLVLIIYVLAGFSISTMVTGLEEEIVLGTLARAAGGFSDEAVYLEKVTTDYANWDEMYTYARAPSSRFANETWSNLTFTNLNVDFVVILSSEGDLLYAKAVNLTSGREVVLSSDIKEAILTDRRVLMTTHGEEGVKGLISAGGTFYLIAAEPIKKSSGAGTVAGALIIGREVDDALVAGITRATNIPIELVKPDPASPPGPVEVFPVQNGMTGGQVVLQDISGNTALGLKVVIPCATCKATDATSSVFFIAAALMGGIIAGVTIILLYRYVIAPLTAMTASVTTIGEQNNLSARLPVHGDDETAKLGAAFNKILTKMEEDEQRLKESEVRLKRILHAIQAGIIIVDAETHSIIAVNAKALDLIEAPEEAVIGATCYQFICPNKEGNCPITDLDQVVNNQEQVLIRSDGVSIPILKTAVPIVIDDRMTVLESFVDIRERKEQEERLAAANRELKDFAYIVSHDLKAPLRGISALSEWISDDYGEVLGEKGKEQINLLKGRVVRMQQLIDGVLAYSRVGRLEEEVVEIDLVRLIGEIVDNMSLNPQITITIDGDLPVVLAGATSISQIFENLLTNAVKYMDKPVGRIVVAAEECEDLWTFSVRDNGPGIDPRHHERIFQIFQTAHQRGDVESTGVGLTIVRKIVERYGGRIWIESTPREGSTFIFTLPAIVVIRRPGS